jgi:hypothetical protein
MKIVPFTSNLILRVLEFTDANIGKNYYTIAEMTENQKKSVTTNNEITSFVLVNESHDICGLLLKKMVPVASLHIAGKSLLIILHLNI